MKQKLLTLVFALVAIPAAAQVDVGYPPPRSPYRDLEFKQEATVFGGYFIGGKDPARAAPGNGALAGVRYEVSVGGPAQLVVRGARAMTDRRIIDPTLPAATRNRGTTSWPLYLLDAGLSVNLTGQRSFRGVVPIVYTGLGVVSDGGKKVEGDPFRLGTTFAISFGGGLRFVPGGRFQVRADAGAYMYQIQYPTAYYVPASDNTAVVADGQSTKFWKRNPAFTIGVSYLLFR